MRFVLIGIILILSVGVVSAGRVTVDLQGDGLGSVSIQKGYRTIVIVDIDDLPRIHGNYEGWLVDMDSGYKLSMGIFNTNLKGHGRLQFRQQMSNFHIYDAVVITSEPLNDMDPHPGEEVLVGLLPDSLTGDHGGHGDTGDSPGKINVPTGHAHAESVEADATAIPSILVNVETDPKSGWNIFVSTTHFDLAPQFASLEHVQGQGHMHLLINGLKVTRLYGEWYHIPASWLGSGTYEIGVALSSNDHKDYVYNGAIIQDSRTIHVS